MGEIRYIIIAKQCGVAGKSLILDGCLKKSVSSVYDLGKLFFGHPSRINDFPCNLIQFCFITISLNITFKLCNSIPVRSVPSRLSVWCSGAGGKRWARHTQRHS